MGRFVGREREIAALQGKRSPESGSRLTVVYGRRRIGKTRLIEEAFKGCEVFKIEGLEDASSRKQRQHCLLYTSPSPRD